MNDYKIISIDNDEYDVIIFSEEQRHPLSNLEEIEKELMKLNLKNNKVLFDMILCRGNTSDRFIEFKIDSNMLVKSSMSILKIGKKNNIRKLSTNILNSNKEMLENSILTSIQKKMILKGIAI
ncbi:type II toxin-antitoxin system RnlB family antitoxin [Clostridium saudiense]|uniref:type II toxin-antitoxin system RnlB family antitoxin n=1 Tax=Clostridium saudiense TaxID=1414720 RepID=UPI0018AB657C|nr:type II toxin-antitoxin system RnlB family antitoxin [Clostridium saudiense]